MTKREGIFFKEKHYTLIVTVVAFFFTTTLLYSCKDEVLKILQDPSSWKTETEQFSFTASIYLFIIVSAIFNLWVLDVPRYGRIFLVTAVYYSLIILFPLSATIGIVFITGLIKIFLLGLLKWLNTISHTTDLEKNKKNIFYSWLKYEGEILSLCRESVYLIISFGTGGMVYKLILQTPLTLPEMSSDTSLSILSIILSVLIVSWGVGGTRETLKKKLSSPHIEIFPVAWQAAKLIISLTASELILKLVANDLTHIPEINIQILFNRNFLTLMLCAFAVFFFAILLVGAEKLNEKTFNSKVIDTINLVFSFVIVGTIFMLTVRNHDLFPEIKTVMYLHILALLLCALIVFFFMHIFNVAEKIITERIRISTRFLMKINPHHIKVHLAMLVPLGFLIATVYKIDPRILILLIPIAVMYKSLRDYSQIHREALSTIEDLAIAFESRDPYTRSHSQNVAHIAGEIAREMYLEDDEIEKIVSAGKLHDLGKIGISDEILGKGKYEKLSFQEYEEIRKHPETGRQITGSLSWYEVEAKYILHHHEWYNGSGYPDGLIGEEIPLGSRILAVAEAFDYMVSQGTYRDPIPLELIIDELKKKSGSQFDPEVVNSLLNIIEKKKTGETES